MAVFNVVVGLGVRLFLNKIVRPYLALLQVHHTEEIIKERRANLMKKVNNKQARDLIASKQLELRLATLSQNWGVCDAIAAEMKSQAQDAVEELKGHLDMVANRYRGGTALS